MALSSDLISQFVQVTKEEKTNKETTVYGTIKEYNGGKYVQLDGSELLTPISITADALDGERVTVMIKDHTATVTGNLSSPSARTDTVKEIDGTVKEIGSKISEFEIIIADKVSVDRLEAEIARIDTLVSENVTITGRLDANEAEIKELTADNVTINGKLTAAEGNIEKLETDKLDAKVAEITYASIENLETMDAHIHNLEATYGEFQDLTTDKLTAVDADIKDLTANKLSATDAELKYANIDFANINMAAVKKLFSDSGIIKDLTVSDGKITGELVGVTIKGDLIEAGTLKADRLVVKGSDGKYYKINTDFDAEAMKGIEPVEEDQIHGSTLVKKSIVAEKIAVDDLVAFGATIGGFHITNDAIYSGDKEGPTNTTRGVYMDNDGQFAVGDTSNYLRYYKDQNGSYKLEISAGSVLIKSGESTTTVEDELNNIKNEMATVKDEVTTLLRIESSRGTVFKNDQIATVLSAVIYRGNTVIRDMTTLKSIMGNSASLEWSWQHLNDESYGVISADDEHIGNDGFTFTVSPEDVDTKVTFMCTLNT